MEVRDWCAKNVGLISNPNAGSYSATLGGWSFGGALVTLANPRPSQYLREDVRSPFSYAGVIAGPFTGPLGQVNSTGTAVQPFTNGVGSNVFYGAVSGGEGRPANQYTNLRSPVARNVFMGTLSFALTDTVNLTTDASWGEVNNSDFILYVNSGNTDTVIGIPGHSQRIPCAKITADSTVAYDTKCIVSKEILLEPKSIFLVRNNFGNRLPNVEFPVR
jgi:hypothetical protein